MEHLKKFKYNWIFFSSIASIIGVVTFYFWPIVSGLAITIIQASLLRKFIGERAWFWLLNPLLLFASIFLYKLDEILGLAGTILALELVFYITIGRFSYMMWSFVIGIPVTIGAVILIFSDSSSSDGLFIFGAMFLPCIVWFGQAHLIAKVLPKYPMKKALNSDILDAL